MLNDVASHLNRNCQCAGTNVQDLRHTLDRRVDSNLETSHPHLFSGLPVFVSDRDQAAMNETIQAIESVTALPAYRKLVLDGVPDIAALRTRSTAGILGYDFHITDNGPQLIEINTNPGGMLLAVEMLRAQAQCCDDVGRFLQVTFDADDVENQIVAAFQQEWTRARGDLPLRAVAIVDETPASQYLYPEFLLFKNLFARHGIETVVVSPDELYLENERLMAGDLQIDLVYNRLTDFNLADAANATLRNALITDTAVIVPNPAAHVLHSRKTNLTLLSNADILRSLGVAGHDAEALLRGVPETHNVDPADGAKWWARRKEWFFKPANGYGSKGSYRGDKVTRGVFESIMDGNYVAQRIAQPSERAQGDGSPFKFDVRNYVHGGKVIVVAARLYQGQTTNFRTVGGGFAPIYEPKLDSINHCLAALGEAYT